MIILRNSGHGENVEFVWEHLRPDLEGTNTGKFLIIMAYLASKVYCLLSGFFFVLI